MRLGSKSPDGFICKLTDTYDGIKTEYVDMMKTLSVSKKIRVMLGDSSITEEQTFTPGNVASFYRNITANLKKWSVRDVMITNNEDCRRVFVKFDTNIGQYLISGHLSLQFHVLLYYRPDYRVIECQKELSEIMEKTKNVEEEMAKIGESMIIKKLGESVKNDEDMQALFEKFYNDDALTENIHEQVEKSTDTGVQEMISKKQQLFKELDGHLLEVYRTSDVLIDDARLVTGEEGFLFTFDLERVNEDRSRDGLFDLAKISSEEKDEIYQTLADFGDSMRSAAP